MHFFSCSGKINVDGADGSVANSGGGSGGTVLINAVNLQGHGILSVNGGQGHGIGGGGSGGRMRIQLNTWWVITSTLQLYNSIKFGTIFES